MATFRVRLKSPIVTDWYEVEADSWEHSALNLHYDSFSNEGISLTVYADEHVDGIQRLRFALVEVEGHEELVTRVYHSGLYRKGGVRPRASLKERLQLVAEKLGWTKDPAQLIAPWEGEDTEWEPNFTSRPHAKAF